MAFKEYENIDELKKVQDLSLGILAEFDRVCRKLGINYAVYGGTAIGTVRHGASFHGMMTSMCVSNALSMNAFLRRRLLSSIRNLIS